MVIDCRAVDNGGMVRSCHSNIRSNVTNSSVLEVHNKILLTQHVGRLTKVLLVGVCHSILQCVPYQMTKYSPPPSDPPTQVSPSYPVPLNTQEVNPLSGKKLLKTEFRNSILGHTNQPWTWHDITYQSSSAKEFCSTSKCLFKLLIRNRWIFTSFKNALEGIIVDYTLQTKE